MTSAWARSRGGRIRAKALATIVAVVFCALVAGWLLTRPDPQRLFQQAQAAARRDPAAAERLFRRAVEAAGGQFPDAQIGLCDVLAQQGEWDEAARVLAATNTSACRTDLLLAFGREAYDADRTFEAEKSLREVALRDAPERRDALELLMRGYRRWGLQDEVVETSRELTRLDPRHFDAWAVLTTALRGMHIDKELQEAAGEALRNDPPPIFRREFRYQLVQLLITRAETARALEELDRLRQDEGDSFRVRSSAIELYRLQGRPDEALEAAQALVSKQDEPQQQATACFIRGSVWIDLGKYDAAVADLEQAVAGDRFNSAAHFKLSEAYRALGRTAPALEQSQIANNLVSTRTKINALLMRRHKEHLSNAEIADELATLYEEIGNEPAAARWKREALLAARKKERLSP